MSNENLDLEVVAENLRTHVNRLCALDRSTVNGGNGRVQAVKYISDSLPVTLVQERQAVDDTENLFARNVARGSTDKPLVILGGHWDAAIGQGGVPVPGADDNASAVAVTLEVARLYAQDKIVPRNHEVEFAFWCLEESGFVGSKHHADFLKERGHTVHGCAVLESVGYFSDAPKSQTYPMNKAAMEILMRQKLPDVGNFYSVVGHQPHENFTEEIQSVMSQMRTTESIPLLLPKALVNSIDLSDHRNFHEVGYPAVMINDTVFYRNANYHEVTDTPDTLDYRRMAELVEVMYQWIKSF
jgi:Zn-dependent M28 family amino/carboxypeptidase